MMTDSDAPAPAHSVKLTDDELSQIVSQASSLSERLSGDFVPAGDGGLLAQSRLDRWKFLSAGENTQSFDATLSAFGKEGATDASLLSWLGKVERRSETAWPTWVATLNIAVQAVADAFADGGKTSGGKPRSLYPKDARVPFGDLLWPIVNGAWKQVERAEPSGAFLFKNSARLGLQKHLLARLAKIVAVPIHTTFLAHKAFQGSGQENFDQGPRVPSENEARPGGSLYKSFVRQQGADGLRRIFRRYPVAARLSAQVTEDWLQNTSQLLRRFERDRPELSRCFNRGGPMISVASVLSGCSDPHNRGQSVVILSFGSGLKLVYKPRPMQVDQTFFDLVGRLNTAGFKPPLRVLQVLDRGDYGWMEFVQHASCANLSAARRYYRRAGALVGLVHWLGGTDAHSENLIAAGEDPVLVDLETLAHPFLAEETSPSFASAFEELARSILRTGLLPVEDRESDARKGSDYSGLDGPTELISPLASMHWKRLNMDEMSWSWQKSKLHRSAHRARLGAHLLSMSAFEKEMLEGYRRLTNLLAGPALNELSLCRARIGCSVRRRVVNATLVYGAKIQNSLAPRCLIWGVDRSLELLALPIRQLSVWPAEIAQLERLDVPYFQVAQAVPEALDTNGAGDLPSVNSLAGQTELLKLAIRRKGSLQKGEFRLQQPS